MEASLTTENTSPDLQQHQPGLQDDEDNQAQAGTRKQENNINIRTHALLFMCMTSGSFYK